VGWAAEATGTARETAKASVIKHFIIKLHNEYLWGGDRAADRSTSALIRRIDKPGFRQ
jgi:hypothetical protein